MTPADFRALIAANDDAAILDATLFSDAAPYAFDPEPVRWDAFRGALSASLNIGAADIRLVGSGRLGFSMKPGNNLRAFQDTSDLDVVVINAAAFDELWHLLLQAAYPRPPNSYAAGTPMGATRNELYTGWISPIRIRFDARIRGPRVLPALQMRTRWFDTLQAASQYPPRRHESIQCRLYRTWDHAELYHLHSVSMLRQSLQP
jgi:hypothetical protein